MEEFGVALSLRSDCDSLLEKIRPWIMLPDWQARPARTGVEDYRVLRPGPGETMFCATLDGEHLLSGPDEDSLGEALGRHVHLTMATRSEFIFVHAGSVCWRGRGIVIPGRSGQGKSSLVKALVEAGAEYYSDEYAVFDEHGRLLPFPRPLMMRLPERTHWALPPPGSKHATSISVLAIRFEAGAGLRLEELTAGQATLELFRNAVAAKRLGARALHQLGQVTDSGGPHFRGVREEAAEAASHILSIAVR